MFYEKLKKLIPKKKDILENKHFKIFGNIIYNPLLWSFRRYSVAKAFSIGLFCAWIPIPFQMILSAAIAIFLKANLPISIALVWITNPITMPPLFFFAYKIGSWILSSPFHNTNIELSFTYFSTAVHDIWKPFLLGCLICGITSAIIGNILVRIIWRYSINKLWNNRKKLK
ncbi:MAG: DUF2062 domain-containing protein [Candidatus Azosocius agrarius]|nr:MAG: DUF2062 domain-containing protein [Gammaproteobacteria bacterium]